MESKYLNHSRFSLLLERTLIRPCTQMWKLIKNVLPLLKENTSRLLGNGREINVCNESIIGMAPLANLLGI